MVLGSCVIALFGSTIGRQRRSLMLNAPQIGDILVLKQNQELKGPANYWPMVIEKVTDEVVFVRPSHFAYPSQSGLDKNLIADIKENHDFFSESVISYPRNTLTSESVEVVVRP